jgi:hypothetical protein
LKQEIFFTTKEKQLARQLQVANSRIHMLQDVLKAIVRMAEYAVKRIERAQRYTEGKKSNEK